jgi:hypothetical protein
MSNYKNNKQIREKHKTNINLSYVFKLMTRVKFSTSWSVLLVLKHLIWKKPWSLIFNKLNVDGWNWKKFNYIEGLKKIAIKRMMTKIKIQNKFYF